MTFYLTTEEALAITAVATGAPVEARDLGLFESALARPRTTVFGSDAYPDLDHKAAAMLQSLVCNHALVDGNKRAGFACTAVFLHVNGQPLDLDEGAAYDLVIAVATRTLESVSDTAEALRNWQAPS